ncbi:sigma-70 family RNA polymerase sigma factor [Pelagibius sp.]|uniref:sigma-70 family RNA polymerase sigma factor n=1 Tax=Pelagibius sp. TaxID=1931238 RepID=UPI00260329F6|nr:sigma-70 family RNA polymerase sigma factor [Pelagibius sp.]
MEQAANVAIRREAVLPDSFTFGGVARVSTAPERVNRKADPRYLAGLLNAVGRNRDRDAFAELFQYFGPRVKAYLMRQGANEALAEELVQESMIMVWRRAESFDVSKSGASTWIFTIARNKRIDALRREKRPEYDPDDPALVPAAVEDADAMVEAAQQSQRLSVAIKTLSKEQADLVKMAYFEDKAHGRIAEETALPLGTVKSRLRLALGHLRKALMEEQ